MRAVSLTILAASVLAASVPRPAAAADDVPPEVGLGAGQLLIGTATASLALAVTGFTDGTPFQLVGLGALFAGPAAVASMVCKLGQTSRHYVGGCGPVMGGAYLGALASLPFLLIGMATADSGFEGNDGGHDYSSGVAIGFMAGYALGSAIGATIAWHASKDERSVWSRLGPPPPLPAPGDNAWPELRWRRVPAARAPAAVAVPVLAFSF